MAGRRPYLERENREDGNRPHRWLGGGEYRRHECLHARRTERELLKTTDPAGVVDRPNVSCGGCGGGGTPAVGVIWEGKRDESRWFYRTRHRHCGRRRGRAPGGKRSRARSANAAARGRA